MQYNSTTQLTQPLFCIKSSCSAGHLSLQLLTHFQVGSTCFASTLSFLLSLCPLPGFPDCFGSYLLCCDALSCGPPLCRALLVQALLCSAPHWRKLTCSIIHCQERPTADRMPSVLKLSALQWKVFSSPKC